MSSAALFEVRDSEGKGLGGFATRTIESGERILAERPMATWQGTAGVPADGDAQAASLDAVVAMLPGDVRRAFFALSQCERHGTQKSALGIWMSNSYPTRSQANAWTDGTSSVFELACRLNHACRPNAHISWNHRLGKQTVYALRQIRRGEEVLVAYIGGDADGSRAARQQQLLKKFSFTCHCQHCALHGVELERSEARQRRISEIVAALRRCSPNSVALVQERKALMEQESMPAVWNVAASLLALRHNMSSSSGGRNSLKLLWSIASGAQAACLLAQGPDAEETIAFASFMTNPAFAKLQKKARQEKKESQSLVAGERNASSTIVAKLEAAKAALELAAEQEAMAAAREVEARERADNAVALCSATGNELLVLANSGRPGHSGSVWMFASGALDNNWISWSDFEYAAARLSTQARRALVQDTVDGELVHYLAAAAYSSDWSSSTQAGAHSKLQSEKVMIDARGCRALRGAVDVQRDRTSDTVDHFGQHHLGLSLERLR